MANIIRSAKSANEWTDNELRAYRIEILGQPAEEFFGAKTSDLALPPTVPADFLDAASPADTISDAAYHLLRALDLAMRPNSLESAVSGFALRLLQQVGYESGRRQLDMRPNLEVTVCSTACIAAPDIVLYDQNDFVLLFQEDKRLGASDIALAQLICQAIAVFRYNNASRRDVGLAQVDKAILPGIIMWGTRPIFYKLPITTALVDAVAAGQYPSQAAGVVQLVPDGSRRYSEGMRPIADRAMWLRYFEAFKRFL